MNNDLVGFLRPAVGVMLIASASAKLVSPESVETTIRGLGLTSPLVSRSLVRLLVAAEFGVGFLVVLSLGGKLLDLSVVALMMLFSATALGGLRKLRGQRCRCFGAISESRFGPTLLARNLLFTAIAGYVAVAAPSGRPLQQLSMGSRIVISGMLSLIAYAYATAARTLRDVGTVR